MYGYTVDCFSSFFKFLIIVTINLSCVQLIISQNIESLSSLNNENDSINQSTSLRIINSDEINFGNEINFKNKRYTLKWGINPNPIFYKQEYYTQKGNTDFYKEKITVEVILGNYQLNDALTLKINELDSLIAINPILDYEVVEDKKNNQFIIDYITNQNPGYYEWNTLRYVKKQKTIILLKYTYRQSFSQNKDLLDFLIYVKKNRKSFIHKIYQYKIPKIKIKRQL